MLAMSEPEEAPPNDVLASTQEILSSLASEVLAAPNIDPDLVGLVAENLFVVDPIKDAVQQVQERVRELARLRATQAEP